MAPLELPKPMNRKVRRGFTGGVLAFLGQGFQYSATLEVATAPGYFPSMR